ncbi:hypothetical protein WA026_013360 [Henosepilachna vigintioctopunctata]|uniref:Acyltransferase n=1 Tax=Henosepilachna vigintioctopunctata TaxID=420089 RepID=A0AAW1VC24_9CUCU
MATKTGGFMRNFLQSKPLVFLGNFNYCVYVFHFLILYLRFGTTTKMVVLSDKFYLINLSVDIIGSFAVAMMLYFLLEHPFAKLQKRLLPQIRTPKKNS